MSDLSETSLYLGVVSFEDRCVDAPSEFLHNGGRASVIRLVRLTDGETTSAGSEMPGVSSGIGRQIEANLQKLRDLGIQGHSSVCRLYSRPQWSWVWSSLADAKGDIAIDATCFTRELLGMVLFAVSVRRRHLGQIQIWYTRAPEKGYATQDGELTPMNRWLSNGVLSIRSIIGFPGDFASDRMRHVVALAGHEPERLELLLQFLEPDRLSISGEMEATSTVAGAGQISSDVARRLRDKIALPKVGTLEFSASSIADTIVGLQSASMDMPRENVTLVAMNTKLSFIGAALFALQNRAVRMVYAVPERYNPLYCKGSGRVERFDITEDVKKAATTPVH